MIKQNLSICIMQGTSFKKKVCANGTVISNIVYLKQNYSYYYIQMKRRNEKIVQGLFAHHVLEKRTFHFCLGKAALQQCDSPCYPHMHEDILLSQKLN